MEMAPEVLTVDYEGEPGRRTFFVQARGDMGSFSYLLEKQQVGALADRLRELLLMIDSEDMIGSATPERDPALEVEQPVELQWRIGTIGLAYEEGADRVVLLIQPVTEDDAGDEAEEDPMEGEGVRFMLRRDQVRSFVLHALAVVEEGRPICQLCGLPMDPSGHMCPASNGHHISS
jgi:uncharacterized repeat protein (TIGR03847 family)